jgi:hypothetical protein
MGIGGYRLFKETGKHLMANMTLDRLNLLVLNCSSAPLSSAEKETHLHTSMSTVTTKVSLMAGRTGRAETKKPTLFLGESMTSSNLRETTSFSTSVTYPVPTTLLMAHPEVSFH